MKSYSRTAAPALALLLATILLISSCGYRLDLGEYPADQIPKEYMESLRDVEREWLIADSVVWRMYEDLGDYVMVACTYEVSYEGVQYPFYRVWASAGPWADRLKPDGSLAWAVKGGGDCSALFGACKTAQGSLDHFTHVDLTGNAWDRRIVKVRVVTTGGKVVETEPVNGFWVIPFGIAVNGEDVKKIVALDKNGKELYADRRGTWPGAHR